MVFGLLLYYSQQKLLQSFINQCLKIDYFENLYKFFCHIEIKLVKSPGKMTGVVQLYENCIGDQSQQMDLIFLGIITLLFLLWLVVEKIF